MQIFVRVAEARSFSKAAQRLELSKSVISKHIAELEKSLGVRLLNRTTRSISLTEIGQEFYERCADVMAAAQDAERVALHLQAEPRGVLKVATPVTFGMLHVAAALPELLKMFPELHIDLTLTNRVVNLVEEGFDVSILIEQQPHAGAVARPICSIQRFICASPLYLDTYGVPVQPEDVKQHQCILFTGVGAPRKWRVTGPDGEVAISVDGRLCINNFNAIRTAALTGSGIALLPHHVIEEDLRLGSLIPLLPAYRPVPSTMCAVYPANRHVSPKVRAFIDFMVRRFGPSEQVIGEEREGQRLVYSASL